MRTKTIKNKLVVINWKERETVEEMNEITQISTLQGLKSNNIVYMYKVGKEKDIKRIEYWNLENLHSMYARLSSKYNCVEAPASEANI